MATGNAVLTPVGGGTVDGVSVGIGRLIPGAMFCLVVVFYLLISLVTFDQIEEDAYIYLRVAENLAEGYGYVFNPGGERIETGSSVIWQFLLVIPSLLSLNLVIAAKLLGILFASLSLFLTWRISGQFVSHSLLRLIPPLWLAVSYPFYMWAQRGLESSLYLFSILWLLYTLLDDSRKKYWYLPALVVLLSRSEGFLFLLVLLPFFWFERSRIKDYLPFILLVMAVSLASYGARLIYFHDLLPHPFYLKMGAANGLAFLNLRMFVSLGYLWFPGAALVIAVLFARRWSPGLVILVSALVITLAWACLKGEAKPYFRHALPFLPFLYLSVIAVGGQWVDRANWLAGLVFACGVGYSMLVLLGSQVPIGWGARVSPAPVVVYWNMNPSISRQVAGSREFWRQVDNLGEARSFEIGAGIPPIGMAWQAQLGRYLAANYPQASTIVGDQMGQTPWYLGRDKSIIDSWGLATRAIGYAAFNERVRENDSLVFRAYKSVADALVGIFWDNSPRLITSGEALDLIFSAAPDLILISDPFTNCRERRDGIRHCADNRVSRLAEDVRLQRDYERVEKIYLTSIYQRRQSLERD